MSSDHSCERCGRGGMNDERPCICIRFADGTHPGTSKLIGARVSITYQHVHQRKGRTATETRHAIAHVLSILPDGALWVRADREGETPFRVEAGNVEACE